MNLHRLMEPVRKLEWTTIGIELVIVVVGVFIGMQVSNWNAERAINALSGRSIESNQALLVSAYRATQYKQKARRRATYDELVSTGTLGLIASQTLRNTALQVYNFPTLENVAREGMQSRYREAFRMTLPNDALVSLLRLRITDIETRLADLTGNNRDVMQGLQAIANE